MKVVEGNLSWTYRGMAANNGLDNSTDNSDQFHNWMVAFPPGDDRRLLLGSGWSERHVNIRSIGLDDRKGAVAVRRQRGRPRSGGRSPGERLPAPRDREGLLPGPARRAERRADSLGARRPVARLETEGVYSTLAALGDSLYLALPDLDRIEVLDASTATDAEDA